MIDNSWHAARTATSSSSAYGSLAPGEELALDGATEAVAVVLSGTVDAWAGEESRGAGRQASGDPFSDPGHSVYAPAGAPLRLVAGEEGGRGGHEPRRRARTRRSGSDHRPGRPEDRHRRGGDVGAQRAHHPRARRHGVAAAVGETLNPPGNWSSYPPHKHDQHNPPEEVALEEVYLFRVEPAGGFGVQMYRARS